MLRITAILLAAGALLAPAADAATPAPLTVREAKRAILPEAAFALDGFGDLTVDGCKRTSARRVVCWVGFESPVEGCHHAERWIAQLSRDGRYVAVAVSVTSSSRNWGDCPTVDVAPVDGTVDVDTGGTR